MIRNTLIIIVLVSSIQMCRCIHIPSAVWRDEEVENLRLSHMVYFPERDQLFIGATNYLYQLQGDGLTYLNHVRNGPVVSDGGAVDNNVTILVLNRTAEGEIYITLCRSAISYCVLSNASDITGREEHFRPAVRTQGAVAVSVVKAERSPSRNVDYTFYACPHSETQTEHIADPSAPMCSNPGLRWPGSDGRFLTDTQIKFKSFSETDIVTEKYVGSTAIEDFRIFFSIQRQKKTERVQTKLAQVCQYRQSKSDGGTAYTTANTYVDMELRCGNYTVMTDVEKFHADTDNVFIATFTDIEQTSSGICLYNYTEIKAKLVENIKDCYRGNKVKDQEDYFAHGRCGTGKVPTDKDETYFLCNKNNMPSYFSVVGIRSLDTEPVVTYEHIRLTAVAAAMVNSELVVFLGTNRGDIRKAVVYPQINARKLDWTVMVANMEVINPDMYTDRHKENVYAMTSFKVAKIPVQTCSEYSECMDCLTSRDPYCGWCVADDRCTINTSCNATWIHAAKENNFCPELSISPNVTSCTTGGREVRIALSPRLPELQTVHCLFHLEDPGQSGHLSLGNSSATTLDSRGNWNEFTCRTPYLTSIRGRISGSANITVSIQTQLSPRPIVHGKMTIYDCMTFHRCLSCKSSLWPCYWCVYENKCVEDLVSCDENSRQQSNSNQSSSACPLVLGVEDNPLFSYNKTLFLPVHDSNDVIVKGKNLLEPFSELNYSCKISGAATQSFQAFWMNSTHIRCHLEKEYYHLQSATGRHQSKLQVLWGNSSMDGDDIPVEVYSCNDLAPPVYNQVDCDKCKSFQLQPPYYRCKWCGNQCIYLDSDCRSGDTEGTCPGPSVTQVSPLKIHMKSPEVRVDIHGVNLGAIFNETIDSVTVGNRACVSQEKYFQPSSLKLSGSTRHEPDQGAYNLSNIYMPLFTTSNQSSGKQSMFRDVTISRSQYDDGSRLEPKLSRLSCLLEAPGEEGEAYLNISLPGRTSFTYRQVIEFKSSSISSLFPTIGPLSGGTLVTIFGNDLDIGREHDAKIGNSSCPVITDRIKPNELVCNSTSSTTKIPLTVSLTIDGFTVPAVPVENVTFSYVDDPVIETITPRKSFNGGGRRLTVTGTNLNAVQSPKLYIRNIQDERVSSSELCVRDDASKAIYCKSPKYPFSKENATRRIRKRETYADREPWLIGFEMDGVQSVRNLPDNLARIVYIENPNVIPFESTQKYAKVLIIKGERMAVAASLADVGVNIGQGKCNVTGFTNESISCRPPKDKPAFNQTATNYPPVEVQIGFIAYHNVGQLDYGLKAEPVPAAPEERSKEYIIAGTVLGILVLLVLVLIIVVIRIMKKRKVTARENEKLMHQMENLEASVSKQCREEFAALQTTMSDLTSDLEGGNILFRDYNVYACKVLFTDTSHPVLAPHIIMSNSFRPGMDTFKGMLKNKEFLLLFIRTLEQQQSFTIQDRSNLASLLMAIHSDNMEFVTDIMKTLLNDLIDKTVAAQRAKLLLRRSECAVEKLVTHWLSICLYHYLKEHTGSALFILYKAIMVQVEKGPLDYITGCAKYTLSEAKLFTAMDAEINAKTLSLHVHHRDYVSDTDHNITVQVLDCDTVTQAKSKLLDVLYKNVPYSERPNVHKTLLEIKENDSTQRMLHDEDSSNEKDGIWKRLNTLQHYNVEDGAKVELSIITEKDISMLSDTNSRDSFIVGSIKRSKQVLRTISGSNFWHLTKQHRSDEMQLSSDLFLPRLLNTKGTLQTYIDDLFTEMFRVGEEPPVIIKYFFDFLDGAAARHGITDPDVLHTWKCNSLLLRFWVNLVKNPEFVFDIHKPSIVDSCLSVITQTLMDSCSTAALKLGKDSPSNKLLFAKDIPRYKDMVKRFFQKIQDKPSVSDQDLNCFLTEKVSQKFGDKLDTSSALLEVYKYASKYKDEIMTELRAMEIPADATSAQNHETPLLMKLQQIYSSMASCNSGAKLEVPGPTQARKSH